MGYNLIWPWGEPLCKGIALDLDLPLCLLLWSLWRWQQSWLLPHWVSNDTVMWVNWAQGHRAISSTPLWWDAWCHLICLHLGYLLQINEFCETGCTIYKSVLFVCIRDETDVQFLLSSSTFCRYLINFFETRRNIFKIVFLCFLLAWKQASIPLCFIGVMIGWVKWVWRPFNAMKRVCEVTTAGDFVSLQMTVYYCAITTLLSSHILSTIDFIIFVSLSVCHGQLKSYALA